MIQGHWFDYACALCAAVSAFYWARSARVVMPTGYDVGAEQKGAFKKAGSLNSVAAGWAAAAAAIPAIKAFGVFLSLVVA